MDRARSIPLALAATLALAGCNGGGSDPTPSSAKLQEAARQHIGFGKQSTTALTPAGSCTALESELKALAAAEIETFFEMHDAPQPMPVAGPGTSVPSLEGDSASGDAGGDYTNNQVAGVDEADFVKTDGERLFVLEGDALHRFDIPAPGTITPAGKLAIEGRPLALLLDGDHVLVVSAAWDGMAVPDGAAVATDMPFLLDERMKTTLIEWPDGSPATVIQERWFDGSYLTAREIEGAAYIVLHGRLPNAVLDNLWHYLEENDNPDDAKAAAFAGIDALMLDDLLPRSYARTANGGIDTLPYTENDCATFEIPEDSNGSGVTSMVTLDIGDTAVAETRHIVSNHPVVYVSADHLFLAEGAQDWWWYWWNDAADERLNVHAFELAGLRYMASARAEGMPINPFALDEHDGTLRIATWTGGSRWWWTDAAVESRVYTFRISATALEPLGQLNGIAPGEQLYAARFLGDTGYLVTFMQIDPLFTIDLADPANPEILGELEVPGFSTYLHPVAGDRLLAVGVGGDETGASWNTVISLFDVSDRTTPALLARHDLPRGNDGWNWSEAMYEHKAFQYHDHLQLLAVPLGASRVTNGVWEWSSTMELVSVGDSQLSAHGSIDHSAYFGSNDGAYMSSPDIRRSFFIGDFIYAISAKAVSVHPAGTPAITVADALISAD